MALDDRKDDLAKCTITEDNKCMQKKRVSFANDVTFIKINMYKNCQETGMM